MTVYYIRADNGAIKIGYTSKDVNSRLQSLSTSSPLDLELVACENGGLKLERQRHDEYAKSNIRGEWFKPSDKLNERIADLNPKYKPIPYLEKSDYLKIALEKEGFSKDLEQIKSWYVTNRADPPKLVYISLLVNCLYLLFTFYAIDLFNIGESVFIIVTAALYPIVIPGFVLINIWHTRRMFSYLR